MLIYVEALLNTQIWRGLFSGIWKYRYHLYNTMSNGDYESPSIPTQIEIPFDVPYVKLSQN